MTKLRFTSLFFFITCGFFLLGCKKEHPNPEQLDPIYKELTQKASEASKALENELQKRAELERVIPSLLPNTIDLKNTRRELQQAERAIVALRQQHKYYEIRAERRRVEGRRAYKIAFQNNEEWPKPEEYQAYLASKRLQEASLNWSERVPKLHQRVSNLSTTPSE